HLVHDPRGGGGHPRRWTCPTARRPAHLFRARAFSRPARATVAAAVGADSVPGVRGLSPDTGHSGSHHPGWFSDRADGVGLPRQLPEVLGLLLVGHRTSKAWARYHTKAGWRVVARGADGRRLVRGFGHGQDARRHGGLLLLPLSAHKGGDLLQLI